MRKTQYVLFTALGLGLVTFFQNCGDGGMTVTRTMSSTASEPTQLTQFNQITQVNLNTISKTVDISATNATLDLSDIESPISHLEFDISLQSVNFSDAVLTLNTANLVSSGAEILTPDILCYPAPGASTDNLINLAKGVFVRSKTREVYISLKGATGHVDTLTGWFSPAQIFFDIYIRPAGTSASNFEKIFCSR